MKYNLRLSHWRNQYFYFVGKDWMVFLILCQPFSLAFPRLTRSEKYNEFPTSRIPQVFEHFVENFTGCELIFFRQDSFPSFDNFQFSRLNRFSSGTYYTAYKTNITFQRHNDIHRYTWRFCSLAIFSFQSYSPEIEAWLVDTFIPHYGPIIRKDQDHFVFVMPNEQLSNHILLSPHFGAKIKFKISLFSSELASGSVTCKTVDLYGGVKGEAQLKTLGHFKEKKAISSVQNIFPDMTHQFNGKIFRFAIPKVAFRLEIRLGPDGKYHPVRGLLKWYFDEAMKKYNFSYEMFYASFGGGTGKQLENGSWVGALADVLYGKADFSSMVGLVYSRHKFIGWSSALTYEWLVFVTPTSKKSYSPNALVWPFTLVMWLLFFVASIAMTLFMKMIVQHELRHFPDLRIHRKISSLSSSFGYICGTFLEQDQNVLLKASSVRILSGFWLLFAIITATAYRGKLVSVIAFPVNSWIPVTFEELANSHFKVALNLVGQAGAAYTWIVSSPNPVIRKLANRVEYIREGEKCLERAMTEELGCMLWKGVSDYVMVKNFTDRNGHVPLEESEETAMFILDGWNFEKRAIFGHTFDKTIQAAVQMGLVLKWFKMDQDFIKKERLGWTRASNITQNTYTEDNIPKPLILSQFSGLILIAVVGILIASIRFSIELLCCRYELGKLWLRAGGGKYW